MPRTQFALMLALTSLLALPISYAHAQESATDATTPIDKKAGNLDEPTDNTLSNQEVQELKAQEATTPTNKAAKTVTGDTTPSVSGTTPSYKAKAGSAAATEGTMDPQQ